MTPKNTSTAVDTTISIAEDALTIRRSIRIDATPERIWQEFADQERMARWWGTGHRLITYEPRVGGWVEMEVDVAGVMRRFGGKILTFDAGRELTFEDQWLPPEAELPLLITLRLIPAAVGGTIVELIQHGFERNPATAAEEHRGHQAGWTSRQLEALRTIVESSA
jgi:uncharacterized protein YndB with AHSA1/START domain